MKKSSILLLVIVTIFYSCQVDYLNPTNKARVNRDISGLAKKLTLDGINVQDTLKFSYGPDGVSGVNWCVAQNGACVASYSEERDYNYDLLFYVFGLWDITYGYKEGLPYRVSAHYDDVHFSTTTFLEYDSTRPVRLMMEYASSPTTFVDLTYNKAGDLIRQVIKNEEGVLLQDITAQFSTNKNPLERLIETPPMAVLSAGFNQSIFYFSKHMPESVITTDFNINATPVEHSIQYTFIKNDKGEVVSASAKTLNDINVHNILIKY